MRYFDLFAGIGGFSLGIERATDSECIGYSEIDKYASAIYRYHWPETRNYGDATLIDTEELPDFDLLTFGWPCQDNSIAGQRKGQGADTRSGLLFEAVRILRDKKPRYFVAENVPGLFSVNSGCDFHETIRMFTDTGYDVQWQVLNTVWFLPQNRERPYFVGHLRGRSRPEVFPVGETSQIFDERATKTTNVRPITGGAHSGGHHSGMTLIVQRPHGYNAGGLKDLPCIRSSAFDVNDFLLHDNTIRRLTPTECERLQGFPDGWTARGDFDGEIKDISDTQRYKTLGNAVSVPVVEMVMARLV